MAGITDVWHMIGMDHPNEQSQRVGAAIVLAARGIQLAEVDAYNLVGEARRQIEHKRKQKSFTAVSLDVYPACAHDYTSMASPAYSRDATPVAS